MSVTNKWPIPEVIEPEDSRCFKVQIPNDPQYISVFIGNLLSLKRAWNWEDSHGDGSIVAYKWRTIIDDAIECFNQDGCCMPILRKNPTNDCEIEQSYDCGGTWESLININDCVIAATKPLFDAQTEQMLDELFEDWDGTPQSINADLVYDSSPDDTWRDFAMCNALQIFMAALVASEVERRQNNADFWEDVGQSLQNAAYVLTTVPIPGARFLAAGAAILGTFIRIVAPLWEAINILALQDSNAVEAVACAMYISMRGATPSSSAFQTSLDNPPFSPISNAQMIANAVKPMLADLGTYLGFLSTMAALLDFAEGGFIDTCVCPEPEWTVVFLGGQTRPPNWSFVPNTPYDLAKYNSPGDYWYAEDTPSQPDSSAYCTVEFYVAGTFTLEWISRDIDLESTGSNTFNSGQQVWLYDDVGAPIDNFNNTGYHQNNTPATVTWEKQNTGIKTVRLQVRIYDPQDNVDTYARLYEIRIHGSGTIPPEWSTYEV